MPESDSPMETDIFPCEKSSSDEEIRIDLLQSHAILVSSEKTVAGPEEISGEVKRGEKVFRKSIFFLWLPSALFLFFLAGVLILAEPFPGKRDPDRIFPEKKERTPARVSPKSSSEAILLQSRNPFQTILLRLSGKRLVARSPVRRGNSAALLVPSLSFFVDGIPGRGHHAVYYSCPIAYQQCARTRPVRAGPFLS